MKTSDKLLNHLIKYGPSRVIDLSIALDLTPADIRYQLKTLSSSGLVESLHPKSVLARGRPATRFVAASQVPVEKVFLLLELFAEQIAREFSKLSTDEIAGKMWNTIKEKLFLSPSPYEKLTQILGFLDSIGVEASWEAGISGPEITIINNPYQIKMNPLTFHMLTDSLVNLALQEAVRD
jgi:predicted ArsR family transcriptional regulator